ncbi:hypothetical protein D9M72_314800 [compost metagenome]
MTTAHDIIRTWCASCGMPAPSNGDVAALLALLFPSMTVAETLGEAPAMYDDDNAALMNERDVEAMRRSGL